MNIETGEVNFPFIKNVLGYNIDEIEPNIRVWKNLIHPDDLIHILNEEKETLKGLKDHFELKFRAVHKNGYLVPIRVRGFVIRNPSDRKPLHFVGSYADITEFKNCEAVLNKIEMQFRDLVEAAPYGIAVHINGIIRYVNPATVKIIGIKNKEEAIGKHLLEYVHPDSIDLVILRMKRQAIEGGVLPVVTEKLLRKDGQIRYVELSTLVGYYKGNSAVFVFFHDITEHNKAEEALRKANHQLNLLNSITRHDIHNLITVISRYIYIAGEEFSDPKLKDYFRIIESASVNIQAHIDFTKEYQNLGTKEPQWQRLDTVIPRSGCPIKIKLNSDLLGVEVYADLMLEQVFGNLLDNSIRHGEKVTEILVYIVQLDEELMIIWEDNGVGIPEDKKEKIFEYGYGKNTGLGMLLVREILMLTDISIRENGKEGKGVRFEIFVPKGGYRSCIKTK